VTVTDQTWKIAKELRVVRASLGRPARLYIDGELFPYATSEGFTVSPRRNEMPGVNLTIVGDRVELVDSLGDEPEYEWVRYRVADGITIQPSTGIEP
jgi:hypothetical protein